MFLIVFIVLLLILSIVQTVYIANINSNVNEVKGALVLAATAASVVQNNPAL